MYGQKAAVEELKNMGASGFARAGRGGTHMLLGVAVARHCLCGGQVAVGVGVVGRTCDELIQNGRPSTRVGNTSLPHLLDLLDHPDDVYTWLW